MELRGTNNMLQVIRVDYERHKHKVRYPGKEKTLSLFPTTNKIDASSYDYSSAFPSLDELMGICVFKITAIYASLNIALVNYKDEPTSGHISFIFKS